MNKRIGDILAVAIAATVIGCGSLQGASVSTSSPEQAGGAFLTADQTYGVQRATHVGDVQSLPATLGQPALQP